MTDRRGAKRFDLYLPIQVCLPRSNHAEFYSAHLRDISTHGIYFHSQRAVHTGADLELTFSLPLDHMPGVQVLVRASGKALRVEPLSGENGTVFGVAAALSRIDFVRPGQSVAA
jgi:hypothetical protein